MGDRGVPMGEVIGLPLLSVDRELGWIWWFWNFGFALCGFVRREDARGESGRSSSCSSPARCATWDSRCGLYWQFWHGVTRDLVWLEHDSSLAACQVNLAKCHLQTFVFAPCFGHFGDLEA